MSPAARRPAIRAASSLLRASPAIRSSSQFLVRQAAPIHFRKMSGATPVFSKDAAPPAGPYSHAIKTESTVYCSGQIHLDAQGNFITGTIGEKTAACFKNLKAVLEASGSSVEKIVKVNVFLTDMKNFAEMNQEYEKWMVHKPARSCVAVYQLPKGADVEIECIALA